MELNVTRVDVWAARIEDQPGGLATKLAALAEAGAKLEFVVARRPPEAAGTGVVFLTPLKGAAQARAARKVGFEKTKSLHSVRVDGPDKPGLGAKIAQTLAEAGILGGYADSIRAKHPEASVPAISFVSNTSPSRSFERSRRISRRSESKQTLSTTAATLSFVSCAAIQT